MPCCATASRRQRGAEYAATIATGGTLQLNIGQCEGVAGDIASGAAFRVTACRAVAVSTRAAGAHATEYGSAAMPGRATAAKGGGGAVYAAAIGASGTLQLRIGQRDDVSTDRTT
ncbi:hypothetical protein D557_0333 [Bordetella holmesii 70147]|uniref:hypothetical protein n=1 Tax=Bordetella holmesii TaxID=35814 RepID=UPI000452ECE8|nr:hypothetical protein [Bordetella holmesii]EWM50490.1 hypothetical protein D557_0333 [Bordetella holmesii 70147]QJP61446.1 hypothetical protein FYB63_16970 [Bordetella holmesii]